MLTISIASSMQQRSVYYSRNKLTMQNPLRVSFLHLDDGSPECISCSQAEQSKSSSDDAYPIDRDGFHRQSSASLLARCDDINHNKSPHEMAAAVADKVKESFRNSLPDTLLQDYANKDGLAPFKSEEIALGRLLGSGEFSNVYEIKSFQPDPSVSATTSNEEAEKRQFMINRQVYRDTKKASYRYALKHLRPELANRYTSSEYAQLASDLVFEAEVLSTLQHPNIIKLRGISHPESTFINGSKGYFLIIDRLDSTLTDRIGKWKKAKKGSRFDILRNSVNSTSKVVKKGKDEELLSQQLEIGLQVAAALRYLHDKNIIFRDLKPDNIGFDVRGDVRLFDFGLAKFIPTEGDPHEEMFHMSMAGTPRYMSPEVLSRSRYNLKADCYTFGMVLWEVLSLQKPFAFARNKRALIDHILTDEGRPEIESHWPTSIKDLLSLTFNPRPEERPKMDFVFGVIRTELCRLRNGDDSKLRDSFFLRRRTLTSTRNLTEVKPARRSPLRRGETFLASFTSPVAKFGRQTTV